MCPPSIGLVGSVILRKNPWHQKDHGGNVTPALRRRRWFGVSASVSVGSEYTSVMGRLLRKDSVSHMGVHSSSLVGFTFLSLKSAVKTFLIERIITSKKAPKWESFGVLNFHVIPFRFRESSTNLLWNSAIDCYNPLSAEVKFVPLSLFIVETLTRLQQKRCRAHKKESVDSELATSICIALVEAHVNMIP